MNFTTANGLFLMFGEVSPYDTGYLAGQAAAPIILLVGILVGALKCWFISRRPRTGSALWR